MLKIFAFFVRFFGGGFCLGSPSAPGAPLALPDLKNPKKTIVYKSGFWHRGVDQAAINPKSTHQPPVRTSYADFRRGFWVFEETPRCASC